MRRFSLVSSLVTLTCLTVAAPVAADERSRPDGIDIAPLGTYATSVYDQGAAEIVAHDPSTQRVFVVNAAAATVDVLDVEDPAAPTLLFTLSLPGLPAADGSTISDGAAANSVAVDDGVVAVAVQAEPKTDPGWVAFFRTRGDASFLAAVRVGPLPDMVTFTPDGDSVVVANEGEPADDYSVDPEGSVSIIDVSRSLRRLTQAQVRTATFAAWDDGTKSLPDGVRVFGPDLSTGEPGTPGRIARNLEPEYIAVDRGSRQAYVTLQEANAVAVLNLRTAEFVDLWSVGTQDYSSPGLVLDASDRDDEINIRNWPVRGMRQPDGIATYRFRGTMYLVVANEGDARDWDGYSEITRVGDDDYPLCTDVFPDADALKDDAALGRLNVTIEDGLREGEGCYEEIYAFGGRSLSIFTVDGSLVYDSGAEFELEVASLIAAGELPRIAFNANHSVSPSFDNRSDDKGIEPEGVALGQVRSRTYAFVGLERLSAVMVYDVTNPMKPSLVRLASNRNWDAVYDTEGTPEEVAATGQAGDLGPEGLAFVRSGDSPIGRPLLIVGNEVSGTTTLWQVARHR